MKAFNTLQKSTRVGAPSVLDVLLHAFRHLLLYVVPEGQATQAKAPTGLVKHRSRLSHFSLKAELLSVLPFFFQCRPLCSLPAPTDYYHSYSSEKNNVAAACSRTRRPWYSPDYESLPDLVKRLVVRRRSSHGMDVRQVHIITRVTVNHLFDNHSFTACLRAGIPARKAPRRHHV